MSTQSDVQADVAVLLALKADYKNVTGADWKPGVVPPAAAAPAPTTGNDAGGLDAQIAAQGNKVRDLKAKKAPKVDHSTLLC